MSTKPILVVYTMSYYSRWLDGVVNRNFHITNELEKKNIFSHILFVDLLPYSFKSAVRSIKYIYAMKNKKIRSKTTSGGKLFFISKNRSLFTASPFFYLLSSKKMQARHYKKLICSINDSKSAISWSFNPLDINFLNKDIFSKTIFDAVDDWRFHNSYQGSTTRIRKNYKKIADSSDYIFTVSDYLSNMFAKEFNRNETFLVPNTSELPQIKVKNTLHKNNVVYLGTIESRFDISLAEFLAEKNPTKHFTYIGPVWKIQRERFEKLTKLKNVTHKGELPFEKVVSKLLPTFDAGIIPHHQSRFAQSNDPLKIYDYLIAGLPVVSTIPTSEKSIKKYVSIAENMQDFNDYLSKVLDENTEEKIDERKKAVEKITWEFRVNEMLNKLSL